MRNIQIISISKKKWQKVKSPKEKTQLGSGGSLKFILMSYSCRWYSIYGFNFWPLTLKVTSFFEMKPNQTKS